MTRKQQETAHPGPLETLQALGVGVEAVLAQLPGGAEVWRLAHGRQELLVVPERPTGLAPLRNELRPELPRLLVAEHVADRDAERFVATGVNFVDAAGNANLDLPGVVIRVLGRRRRKAPERRRVQLEGREWRGPTLRLLFHLLCDPALVERPIRDLAALVEVATGTVVRLLDELEGQGCLLRPTRGTRRFVPTAELRDHWIGDFVRRLRPRLLLGRFTPTTPDWHVDFDPLQHGALWGGEASAAALGADLRPGIRTLYTAGDLVEVLRPAGLRGDPHGTVEVRRRFWAADLEGLQGPAPDLVPKLLIEADLIGTRDPRCLDAARKLTRLDHA